MLAEPEQSRANYEIGWPVVLEPFATAALTPSPEATDQAPSPEAKDQAL